MNTISDKIPLTTVEKAFIAANAQTNLQALLLKQSGSNGLDLKKLAVQIAARQRLRHKLPTWVANPDLVFPQTVSVEQASSEQTARYKAGVVAKTTSTPPAHLIDGTGGMGVDTWAFAGVAQRVTYLERDADLAQLAQHNLPLLGCTNATVLNTQSDLFLTSLTAPVDWIYLDPARRDSRGARVAQLDACEPNVVAWWPMLQARSTHILLKTAPLIDLEATIRQLPNIQAIHVVAVQHEVKEVLFVAGTGPILPDDILITAVDMTSTGEVTFTFRRADERSVSVPLRDPAQYLYEPNAAILKAGAFRAVAARFGLTKLAAHSHLYTSETLINAFPGRTFRVEAVCKPSRSELQAYVPTLKANLTVRNFPQTVEDLRKKLSLKEGGDQYVFATTLQNGDKRLLVTSKVASDRIITNFTPNTIPREQNQ